MRKNAVDIMFSKEASVLSCNTSVFICLKALAETPHCIHGRSKKTVVEVHTPINVVVIFKCA